MAMLTAQETARCAHLAGGILRGRSLRAVVRRQLQHNNSHKSQYVDIFWIVLFEDFDFIDLAVGTPTLLWNGGTLREPRQTVLVGGSPHFRLISTTQLPINTSRHLAFLQADASAR